MEPRKIRYQVEDFEKSDLRGRISGKLWLLFRYSTAIGSRDSREYRYCRRAFKFIRLRLTQCYLGGN